MEGREVGDAIRGSRIYADARKISDPVVIVKTGRHKAQRVILSENAVARVEKKLSGLRDRRRRAPAHRSPPGSRSRRNL